MYRLEANNSNIKVDLQIGGSKSESNRLLILQALFDNSFEIENLSFSKDSKVLQQALASESNKIDIGMAGTAMRFLAAFYSIQDGREVELTGSERMQNRPIGDLVEALRSLGADISYVDKEGFPPLLIKGKKLSGGVLTLNSSISSQYISALMLIAPKLEKGLKIALKGKTVSWPYINMTAQILEKLGVELVLSKKEIEVKPLQSTDLKKALVESDWSSASYHYGIAAVSCQADIMISNYKRHSFQGDSALIDIYKAFGVETIFLQDKIRLQKTSIFEKPSYIELDLNEQPDLAQTIAVTCLAMGIDANLKGLETLKIKETDRILALKKELEKFGAEVIATDTSLSIKCPETLKDGVHVETYDDHRMAMAFAQLCLVKSIFIENPMVVEKSYPDFWDHLRTMGIITISK